MRKWLAVTFGSALVIAVGIATAMLLSGREARELRREIVALEQEKTRLAEYAERLTHTTRIAQVEVLDQTTSAAGAVTTLRFTQIAPDGTLGEPCELSVDGDLVYFDALVLKFEFAHVAAADPQRGVSLHLFRRIFGNRQSPDSAPDIGRSTRPRLADRPEESPLECELWERFWKIVDDPNLAAKYGVRIAQVEAPAAPLRKGDVWELFRDAAGGLNIRKLGART